VLRLVNSKRTAWDIAAQIVGSPLQGEDRRERLSLLGGAESARGGSKIRLDRHDCLSFRYGRIGTETCLA
jgi:hypothetical protein